jgi:sulfur carrier protein
MGSYNDDLSKTLFSCPGTATRKRVRRPRKEGSAVRGLGAASASVSLERLEWVGFVEITVNGQPQRVSEGTTIAELLAQLGLAGKYVAVEANLQLVPRSRHAQHLLADGDRLEIVTLVGGG